MRMPTTYIPHGGGPCFFMTWTYGPADTWDRMAAFLRTFCTTLPGTPRALLVVSAHWEEAVPTVQSGASPALYYDYSGFPPHTYALSWPAAGSPALAARVRSLLAGAGIRSGEDASRGFDHGVFIPMLLAFPDARVPTIQLSLRAGLDAAEHLAIGRALAPLRDEGVLILGSGMSYHNMRGGRDAATASSRFGAWLDETLALPVASRDAALTRWEDAPDAHACHPRSEHLTPLFVVAGAAGDDAGRRTFTDRVLGATVSAYAFG